ncbi:MAG TPA: hypothetical protein VEZ14_12050 [Dehalococcoidia bacterium]|nr:hypothetical protein [Dehalococcoidia bacterium]
MVFRRIGGDAEKQEVQDEDADGLRVVSGDDEDEEGEAEDLFEEGQPCDLCQSEEGRVGLDPTCRGAYDGEPVLMGYKCLEAGLKDAYGSIEGVAVVVEPFGEFGAHYYYRLDEMPEYEFVREDVEAVSWLMLAIGDACARCGEQSHVAWLTREFVDQKLPENRPVFRNLEGDVEKLCRGCAASALAVAYASLKLPLMTVELPRSAMGVLMPTGE